MKKHVICLVCGRKFKKIPPAHIKSHNLTFDKYLRKFPDAQIVSDLWRKEQSKRTSEYIKTNPKQWEKHQNKVRKTMKSLELKKRMSLIKKIHWKDPVKKNKLISAALNRWSKKEERKLQSNRKKEFFNDNPDYAKQISKKAAMKAWELKGGLLRKKCKERFNKEEERQKQSKRIKIFMDGEQGKIWKEEQSRRIIQYFKENPGEASRRMKGFLKTKQGKQWQKKMSKIKIEQYIKNPELLKKWSKACRLTPNKKEMELLNLLKKHKQGFDFVGDGKVVVGGKLPDYIHKEKRLLIELFGDYWHRGENPKDRITHFKKYGYACLVIWEKEMKDANKVIEKVMRFTKID